MRFKIKTIKQQKKPPPIPPNPATYGKTAVAAKVCMAGIGTKAGKWWIL